MDLQKVMYETLKEVQKKVDEIRETQIEQSADIRDNKESLVEHMRRTEILEGRVDSLEEVKIGKAYIVKSIKNLGVYLSVSATLVGLLWGLFSWLSSLR